MKIIVLNGSPKGNQSVTHQHILFLEKHFKNAEFKHVHIGKRLKTMKDEVLDQVLEDMISSDLIVWTYPVYTFCVPYQLMAFINRLSKHKDVCLLKGKHTTQFSTSKHFYDVTASDYIREICHMFEMNYLSGMMADMEEMLTEKGRYHMISFFDQVTDQVEKHLLYPLPREHRISLYDFDYKPVPEPEPKSGNILIVYNGQAYSETIRQMILAFENLCEYEVHRLDTSNIHIQGPCMGCLDCTFTGHCIYRDGFEKIYREKIMKADVLVYASDIENHYMNEDFKLMDDRAFFNGHRVNLESKAVTYLLNGGLTYERNLKTLIEARASVGHMVYIEPVTTEYEDILGQIKRLVYDVSYFMEKRPYAKASFYESGGMKIFRDLVYEMRALMHEDHAYYKKNNLYDYPKPDYIKNFFLMQSFKWMSSPKRFHKMKDQMNKKMLERYKEILEEK
ncbi:hypothetical protein EZV73_08590 [Acidaminobacter sp. JC074]|uniref:NAD(P)H-dependent oxidoreductase n=1 Tax=Acidaminobacter sp. JC074 TaxID=2530199 RepID=UPI001F0EA5A2|nr:NAD(P)H-dependent oxidoreductase [Acidaminobacter sp. JC074]MCH4887628.1 hypothetical protein [Acidaminobacter sp. JC074]